MWGPPGAMVDGQSPCTQQGIVPRMFQMLFREIKREKAEAGDKQINYQCRCSFLEIYHGQIGDLLDPTQRNLQIKDDAKNGFYIENLSEEYVSCYDDVTQILIKGLSSRKVGATSINSKSSRSHIIFTCVIESWCKETPANNFSSSKTSRISLIDLAGLGRNKQADAGREFERERKELNSSLSHLGTRPAVEQKRMQANPCQILVATPGRLRDHLENTAGFATRLMGVKVLVLDEADHLLDMGFRKDIEKIVAAVPKQRQTLLFSATIPDEVRQICHSALKKDYEYINTVVEGSGETHSQVRQMHLVTPLENQFPLVYAILKDHISDDVNYKHFKVLAMYSQEDIDEVRDLWANYYLQN